MENRKEKIFIAEDDERISKLIIRRLENEGYEVYTAVNGRDALTRIQEVLPDLIILDISMPELDGYQVKQELSKQKHTANIPVIYLTARVDLDDKVKGLNLGADDYITKPFKKEELLARIEAILRRKRYYEYLALHDNLTGLFNRTYFYQQFTQFFNMAERYKNIFSLIFIDINKFKKINDTHGHKTGDTALKLLSGMMQENLRKSDIISRYGGDEFAVILPYTVQARAEEMAHRLADVVKKIKIPVTDSMEIRMSISIGIVEYSPEYKNADQMLEVADKRMYEYKIRCQES
ncbi:MAG: diguanylate cyclase [Spirochaetales bacterium]|nr:diguanylate cyclase [Spirochaetales bacterium]